ncbi:MAG: aspartate/tyrosine/aromatic aminotransferase [Chlamydiia bacterium]|nr:aspartate/tyrosine/aromatic aminotransferase [Chlamydiia bacterium]
MAIFSSLELAPPDPIFGLTEAYKLDKRKCAVNLGVGAYKTSEGDAYVLECVRRAEESITIEQLDKEYLPIGGDPSFVAAAAALFFDPNANWFQQGCLASAQTIGATSALYIAGRMLIQAGIRQIAVSDPTWANHLGIFGASGMEIAKYPYWNPKKKGLDGEAMLAGIAALPAGTAVLLHASCHNPTGCDPTPEQWHALSDLMAQKRLIPVFDMAYQGFGLGLDEDAYAPRYFADRHEDVIMCGSFSKNFGLYGERVGTLSIKASDPDAAKRVLSQIKACIRGHYSNPPSHGAYIVRTILANAELRGHWEAELTNMRTRIQEMRETLISGLLAKGGHLDFNYMTTQQGMFSFTGLSADQVLRLREEYGIYMPPSGRINVAGINSSNIDYVVDSFLAVMG